MVRHLWIAVDRTACAGNAMCMAIAPNTFDIDDLGKASVVDPRGDSPELALEAAANCPVRAISVTDADTGDKLYPRHG